MAEWKQQRPDWCPHSDCQYRMSSQACLCVGELPVPTDHDGDKNTHRLCLTQSLPNDPEWHFSMELNRTDAWTMVRVLNKCFDLNTPRTVETSASNPAGARADEKDGKRE